MRRRARLALAAVEGGGRGAGAGEVGDGARAPRRKKKAAAAIVFIPIADAMNRQGPTNLRLPGNLSLYGRFPTVLIWNCLFVFLRHFLSCKSRRAPAPHDSHFPLLSAGPYSISLKSSDAIGVPLLHTVKSPLALTCTLHSKNKFIEKKNWKQKMSTYLNKLQKKHPIKNKYKVY